MGDEHFETCEAENMFTEKSNWFVGTHETFDETVMTRESLHEAMTQVMGKDAKPSPPMEELDDIHLLRRALFGVSKPNFRRNQCGKPWQALERKS
mmetsp:Transcript_28062/g.38447  ORF Transcript_28062/g.38447 Transcript_28062/m.38447 type:complete len:95 (+) Transcript_28062:624-908(+)